MKGLNSLYLRIILSFIVTLILGVLFFTLEQPYVARIIEKRVHNMDKNTTYLDLNSDGRTERILLANSVAGQTGILAYDPDGNIIDQYNLKGRYVKRSHIFHGDYNGDKLSELYVFTYIGDSLFLNIIKPYDVSDPILARKYIEGCSTINEEAQYIITGPAFEDVNNDGYMEFYFSIAAGFTLQPRAMYYYDIENNIIEHSAEAGSSPRYYLESKDIDNDGKIELWGRSNAVGNYKVPVSYTDSSAWLMIYDYKLNYKFEPIEFKGFTSVVFTSVLSHKNKNLLLVNRSIQTKNDEIGDEIALYDSDGNLHIKKSLNEYNLSHFSEAYTWEDKIYLVDVLGNILIFDYDLNIIRADHREWTGGARYGPFKMKENREAYLVFLNSNGEMVVCNPELRKLASLDIDDIEGYYYTPVYINNRLSESGFHLRTQNFDYFIELVKNTHRNYIFLYAVLMFTAFYFLIYFIQAYQYKQELKQRKVESKMKTLQMQAIKSQMSPHFIFNALNSISAMYIKGDKNRADAFLTSFSKMIREIVDTSDKLIVRLEEELEFVRNYLELEQVRHQDRLSFSINLPNECRNINIPSMSIHAFAENTVKHTLKGKDKIHVLINAVCLGDTLKLTVMDNGIGYSKTLNKEKRAGKGLRMVEDIFETYRSISGKKISYTITDLGETASEERRGTLVEINVQI